MDVGFSGRSNRRKGRTEMLVGFTAKRDTIAGHLARRGATIADLAQEQGRSPAAVYRWLEPGRRLSHPTRQRLLRSGLLDGLSFDDLFEQVGGGAR